MSSLASVIESANGRVCADTSLCHLTLPRFHPNQHRLDINLPIPASPCLELATRPPPVSSLGPLQQPPFELFHQAIIHAPLRAFFNLRYTSRQALEAIDSRPQVKAILWHARTALAGIQAIKTGWWSTSCDTLYRKLRTSAYDQCWDYAGFLYLTCHRVCLDCLYRPKVYRPLRQRYARSQFGLTNATLHAVPLMQSLRGKSARGCKKRPSVTLYEC